MFINNIVINFIFINNLKQNFSFKKLFNFKLHRLYV